MKKLRLLAVLSLLALVTTLHGTPPTLPRESPGATVSQVIGITNISVSYHRPSVNGREIWGKVVPYGFSDPSAGTTKSAPWRAGANENTTVTFQHDVTVSGHPVTAGTYALFMAIADTGNVTVIFSYDHAAWGNFFYDPARDALRFDVKWEDALFQEQLRYDFSNVTANSAVLALSWEKKRIPFAITVDTNALTVASLKSEMQGSRAFEPESWIIATRYLLDNKGDLALALQWADNAMDPRCAGKRTGAALANKARVLEKMSRADEAKTLMDESLKISSASEVYFNVRRLIGEKQFPRALEVAQLNAKLHPGEWPVSLGLARGYSANGNFLTAIEALTQAMKEVPGGDPVTLEQFKVHMEKLKRGVDFN